MGHAFIFEKTIRSKGFELILVFDLVKPIKYRVWVMFLSSWL